MAIVDAVPYGRMDSLQERDDLVLVTDKQEVDAIKHHFGNPYWWDFDGCLVKVKDGEYDEVYCFAGNIPFLHKPIYKIETLEKCPKGYHIEKGVCASEPNEKGEREVLLGFSMIMDERFDDWSYIAKDILIDHLDRSHASDFTDGNIDYQLQGGGWQDRVVYGDIKLEVPESYWDDAEEGYFVEVGQAALDDTVKYNLDHTEQDVIEDYNATPIVIE